ncbi:hypothetical protein CC1G_00052 [Coprinopsis cinerea okayama7|uniref:HIT-type domain-containing protein n=1 Tax=Coprinopsis cinerea (strain Okayama-7 / 130 / ATCC MYA-4618 / FGSC 9003) TaxID=240176 RepID=A8NWK5_COPC7|nr:hypothetical protein CC1G_00052 [Coprinopsis cinerea okayama7\|eukprot:XP_001836916.2 hypothetical protein CC1G_00052 [Coprinopsis cinerea okayama7\
MEDPQPSTSQITATDEPSSSSPAFRNATQPTLCSLCPPSSRQPTKYTCPRCRTKTCSAPCSKRHKQETGCSGERNKAEYVSMKDYGWGAMMSDYTFLEEVGRKVKEVGKEIVGGGYMHSSIGKEGGFGAGMRGKDGMRGHPRGRGRGGGNGKTKRDIFKMQMEVRDIEVDLLPLGMKRRKMNQSSWDFKNQTGLVTLEFKFHAPRDPLLPKPSTPEPPLALVTHRNRLDQPLLAILQSLAKDRSKKESLKGKPTQNPSSSSSPEWLMSMLVPSEDDPEGFTQPKCVMRAPTDPVLILQSLKEEAEEKDRKYASDLGKTLSAQLDAYSRRQHAWSHHTPASSTAEKSTPATNNALKRRKGELSFKFPKVFYNIDLNQPLSQSLKYTSFVEFPTIEVFEEGDERFGGVMFVDPQDSAKGSYSAAALKAAARERQEQQQPQAKRRKLDPKVGRQRLKGLIGDYGSSSSDGEGGEENVEEGSRTKRANVAALVAEYTASDDEGDEVAPPTPASSDDKAPHGDVAMIDDDELGDEDAEGEDDDELDPAALLELVRKVKGEQWAKDQENMEDDVLDWEGSDADAEGEPDDEDY